MKKLLSLLVLLTNICFAQTTPTQVLDKAASYHDPNGEWKNLSTTLQFTETRPSGDDRKTTIVIDNSKSYMKVDRNNENIYEVSNESAEVLKGEHDEKQALRMRNYYLYLWGLPMKLYDEGTPFDRDIEEDEIDGKKCHVLRVVYEEDTWYFYIDQSSGRMLQYRFYKDEEAGKGELITLEDEIMVGQIKIPQKRSWYTLPEMKYLGTDILTGSE
ncbi:MAG: DUF6503 family protein [Cyclobacteriaceae bacterium]